MLQREENTVENARDLSRAEKTFIIGDVHGCNRALRGLLERLEPDSETDRLIFLGDLFDRGPESWEVLQTVKALTESFKERFVLLRGNHEDYLLQPKLTFMQRMTWNQVGRPATVNSFKQHREKMESSIPWLEEHCRMYYKEARFQCAHAGIKRDPIEDNDDYTLLHDHDVVMRNHYHGPFTVTGHIALNEPVWFKGEGKYEKPSYGEWHPLPEQGVLCIDTGCGKGGALTGMIIQGKSYWLESEEEEQY